MKQRHSRRHNAFRAILKDLRLAAGLSQQQLAARLKRSDSFISDVERGTRMLDVLEFIDYAEALGADPRRLLGKLK